MHRLIQDHLEELLEGQSLPANHPVPAHLAVCVECRDEVDGMRMQNTLLRSFALTGDVPEVEPRPGFYARVLERIEAQRPVSIWALFTDSAFGRGVAVASLAVAMVMGVYVITGERDLPSRQTAMVDPLYPQAAFPTDAMAAGSGNGANSGEVLASLVSYEMH